MVSQSETVDQSTVLSVDRALMILEWLSERDSGSQSIRMIAESTGLRKSTVHRLLETLAKRGWVVQTVEGSYKLGTKALHISAAVLRQLDVLGTIRPCVMQLRSETAQTAFICVEDNSSLLIVDIFESPSQLRFTRPIGSRSLLHASAAGKALLAQMPPSDLDAYLITPLAQATVETITDPEALRRDLDLVRERGYAVSNNEGYPGIMSFGAVVRNHMNDPVAAISISGPRDEMIRDQESIIDSLRAAANHATAQLGGKAMNPSGKLT